VSVLLFCTWRAACCVIQGESRTAPVVSRRDRERYSGEGSGAEEMTRSGGSGRRSDRWASGGGGESVVSSSKNDMTTKVLFRPPRRCANGTRLRCVR